MQYVPEISCQNYLTIEHVLNVIFENDRRYTRQYFSRYDVNRAVRFVFCIQNCNIIESKPPLKNSRPIHDISTTSANATFAKANSRKRDVQYSEFTDMLLTARDNIWNGTKLLLYDQQFLDFCRQAAWIFYLKQETEFGHITRWRSPYLTTSSKEKS